MSTLIDAFDENTWDGAERAYFEYVDDVIARGKDERFSNGKPWHAAYLIFKFLQTAQQCVRIFSGTLVRSTHDGVQVYEAPQVIGAACRFLKRPGSALRIALEKDIDAPVREPNNHPLVAAVRRLKEYGDLRGSLEIRRVNDETIDALRQRDVLYHMMLMDERGWRLETDPNPTNVKAIVNAGNGDEATILDRAFDTGVWPHGEILVAVTA